MKVVILGGGLTGLVCAYELQKKDCDYLLVEKEKEFGGLCRSVKINNFIFDYTGHFLHFHDTDKTVSDFVLSILKDNLLKIERNSKIYTKYASAKSKLIPYPFQANIKYLLLEIKKKCFYDIIKAQIQSNLSPQNFYEWLNQKFGKTITHCFFLPYNTKLWKTNLTNITTTWVEKFVPQPNIERILEQIIFEKEKNIKYGYNAFFYYPKNGGIQVLINSIVNLLDKRKIISSAEVVKVDIHKKIVYFLYNGKLQKVCYDKLISTLPIKEFVKISNVSDKIKNFAEGLKYCSVLCFNIALRKKVMDKIHWIYFPDKEISFYRVGFYHNISSKLLPSKQYGSLYVEISLKNFKNLNLKHLYKKVVKDLIKVGIIVSQQEILFYDTLKIPYGYVIYDYYREKVLPLVIKYLNKYDIVSIGRYGGWKYSYMSENIKDAIETVKKIC